MGVAARVRVGVGAQVPPPARARPRLRRPEAQLPRPRMRFGLPSVSAGGLGSRMRLGLLVSALWISPRSGVWWSGVLWVFVVVLRCPAHQGVSPRRRT